MDGVQRNEAGLHTPADPTPSAPRTSPVGIPSGYQPALDGIRAVAVGMVMFFHIYTSGGLRVLVGGWLGVDVFFVLSGYLITSLLMAEFQRTGRIGLWNFYVRRFLRLAPLSIALVAFCLAVDLIGPSEFLDIHMPVKGALAILLYYGNWWDIAYPGGLGSLEHTWSLAMEEQFYFVWPWVVVGAITIARRHVRAVLIAVTTGGVLAMGLARRHFWLVNTRPGTAGDDIVNAWLSFFRNSLLRGDGLVFGCLLALLLHGVTITPLLRRIVAAVAVPAVVVACSIVSSTRFGTWQPWVPFIPVWGLSLFDLSVTLVVAWLVVAPRSPLGRVLSLRPLTWIGRRAYGIYLLHPLVIGVVLAHTHLARVWRNIVVIPLTLVVAGISFRWLESPFLKLKERFSSQKRSTRPGSS